MANFTFAFKSEVARLARKEARALTSTARSALPQLRRDMARMKRDTLALQKRVAFLEGREKKRLSKKPAAEAAKGLRFSPKWVKSDRTRLGLSAKDYGRLVGVSLVTIYNWEGGKSKPQAKQLAALAAVRGIGKRDALRRLEVLGG